MEIAKKTSTVHTGYLKGRSIDYIVLHYTAGTSSKKGTARNVAAMFANPNNRAASADFIVDDGEIVQYNGDIANRYTYAVGGSRYTARYTPLSGMFYGKCKNSNSVSIEMCSTKANTKTLLATDTDWALSASVVDRAAELVRHLMRTYNVPIDRVIMHHHVTGKLCPQPWCLNPERLKGWYRFLEQVKAGDESEKEEEMSNLEIQALIDKTVKAAKAEILAEVKKMIPEEKVFNTENEIPEWYLEGYEKVKPALKGTGNGNLGLNEDLLRMVTICNRMGIFG